uniref:Uncharacterized protein n=1 Tax=Coturnix japonica TaxID=93934 RepID=A0A8C2TYB3_COTJA
ALQSRSQQSHLVHSVRPRGRCWAPGPPEPCCDGIAVPAFPGLSPALLPTPRNPPPLCCLAPVFHTNLRGLGCVFPHAPSGISGHGHGTQPQAHTARRSTKIMLL